MSAVAELLDLDAPADYPRDRWGRPLVIPANGGKPQPYTRCSSAAKTIEDTYNLEMWARRNVAFGLAHDASLAARVLAVGGNPSTWGEEDRKEIGRVVADAEAVAQAHKAADIGTAVHRLTERLDRGEEVSAGPYAADLDAYQAALDAAGIVTHPVWIECRMVNDDLQMAGTADRIVTIGDQAYICDLKTGGSVSYRALGYAAQLAAYATGVLYDPATGTRLDTPAMDRQRGLIIHLPAGSGTCTLHWVDLEAGYAAARLANEVRRTRKAAKKWMTPVGSTVTATDPPPTVDPHAERIATEADSLRARLNATLDQGARPQWPVGVPTFRNGGPRSWKELLAVEATVIDCENQTEAPFAHDRLPADPDNIPEPRVIGGGPSPRQQRLDALAGIHAALPTDLQAAAHGAVLAAGVDTNRARWSDDDIDAVAKILNAATSTHEGRKALVASLVQDFDDEQVSALCGTCGLDLADLDPAAIERLEVVVGSIDNSHLGIAVDDGGAMTVVVTDKAEEAVLSAHGGSKAEVLAAAKDKAATHGRPAPRSTAQAMTDPVLVALLLAGE